MSVRVDEEEKITDESVVESDVVGGVPRFRDAFERLRPEIEAVPFEQLIGINVDIPYAVTTVLGSMIEINALRERIVGELPKFDVARFDKLEAYTLALGHAHTLHSATSRSVVSLSELLEQCTGVRDVLLSDAQALAHGGPSTAAA